MPDPRSSSTGLLAAVGAYGLWGLLPVYFIALMPTGPVEIVAWRILLSLVFCLLLIAATRTFPALRALVVDRRILLLSAVAAVLIAVNWHVYVYASLSGFILEAALGYFINPIVTVALGVVFLRERLRPAQWCAVGLSVIAVIVLAVGYGTVPVIALALAFSFGFYAYVKNRMGPRVSAVGGLTLETAWLVPTLIINGPWETTSSPKEIKGRTSPKPPMLTPGVIALTRAELNDINQSNENATDE